MTLFEWLTMSFPLKQLPVVQNWDCHARGTCCKEYQIPVSEEERQRIEEQGWDEKEDLEGLPAFVRKGIWKRRYYLNHRSDGSCVFLSEEGRCRIHERFGYETKPLPCRLFPFVMVPVGDHWRVSMRFACPSAAANLGRPVPEHKNDLIAFADQLMAREDITPQPDGAIIRPPKLQIGRRASWPDLIRFMDALLRILQKPGLTVERRLRSCLTFARECQQADLSLIEGERLGELLQILQGSAVEETPQDPGSVSPPSWVGRVLFRQALAVYTRKDYGPKRGLARRGRMALLGAAIQFARGKGSIPRLHDWLPEGTFEAVEKPLGKVSPVCEQILERYYLVKVGSGQFFGPASFGMNFWEGFEHLALTFPILQWVTRVFAQAGETVEEGLTKALSIVDDHFGFNPVLRTFRQRLSFRILARREELARLIAWYSR